MASKGENREAELSWKARVLIAVLRLGRFKKRLISAARKDDDQAFVSRLRSMINGETLSNLAPEGLSVQRRDIAGVACDIVAPGALDEEAILPAPIIYFHGGGYVAGPMMGEAKFAAKLARHAHRPLVFVRYPLSPQHTQAERLAACVGVYSAIVSAEAGERLQGVPDIVGVSAGGGLSIAVAAAARDADMPLPERLLLVSMWADLATSSAETMAVDRRDPALSPTVMQRIARIAANGGSLSSPDLSPVLSDLSGLPPMNFFHGGTDILSRDARILAQRARGAGVKVAEHWGHGLPHTYLLANFLPESKAARGIMVRILKEE